MRIAQIIDTIFRGFSKPEFDEYPGVTPGNPAGKGREYAGTYCDRCGSPEVTDINVVLRYDTLTGKPIIGRGDTYCSRDRWCQWRGMPGF